jgi:demethylmenaquinone methyltransferase/2-methoxy-6-polyprenyl-1,4-benzoquinol methylase
MSKTNKDVLASYDRQAPVYDALSKIYFFGKDNLFRSMITESLSLRSSGNIVLNLCSGTGLDFPFLIKKIKQGTLLAVDLSSQMLKQAKKKIGNKEIDLIRADAANLPFSDETFDAILVSFCLKITPTYKEAIEETVRVLKLNKRIGVLANHKPSNVFQLPGIILTKVLSRISKINFEINLEELLSEKFRIIEDKILYGGFLRLFVAEKTVDDNFK